MRDSARDDLRGNEGWEYARKLLGIMAPHLIAQRKTQDEDAATTYAIQGRLKAQKNIGATPLTDEGDKGFEALNEMMEKHFKGGA